MSTSQNGWPVLPTGSKRLRKFVIPGAGRTLILRDGSAGFLLVHIALWWHETISPLNHGVWDEWGHAVRPIRGKTTGYSNHASGTAEDLDATEHPRGVAISRTFKAWQTAKIRLRLRLYSGVLGWGGNYHHASNVDGMHFELIKGLAAAEKVARRLMKSPRGKRILAANPGLKRVIES